jgi:hypothetical protein
VGHVNGRQIVLISCTENMQKLGVSQPKPAFAGPSSGASQPKPASAGEGW